MTKNFTPKSSVLAISTNEDYGDLPKTPNKSDVTYNDDTYKKFYDSVYSRDFGTNGKSTKVKEPHGWVQWKGTDACIDLHCKCGHHSHYDGDFLYYWSCKCGAKYALGMNVKLIELDENEIQEVIKRSGGFKTSLEDE